MRRAFKNFMENFKKDEKGMTLVELLAVIVILAIVGAIAFVVIGNVIENSRQDAHISNAQQIINAAELAEASGSVFTGENSDSIGFDEIDNIGELIDPWGSLVSGPTGGYAGTFTLNRTDDGFTIVSNHDECEFGTFDGNPVSKTELSTEGRELCGTDTP